MSRIVKRNRILCEVAYSTVLIQLGLMCRLQLIVSLESLPSEWRNTIQPQQSMLLASQYSELAH